MLIQSADHSRSRSGRRGSGAGTRVLSRDDRPLVALVDVLRDSGKPVVWTPARCGRA
jgi:hypothetical protein